MIGELATGYTWQSVMFDAERQQRQAADKFAWGDQAPHQSTVILCDRPFTQHPSKDKPAAVGIVNNPLAHPARCAFSVTRVCAPVAPDVFSTICVLRAAT